MEKNYTSPRDRIRARDPLREVPDPVPMEIPADAAYPESTEQMLQRFVRQEVARFREATADTPETPENLDLLNIDEEEDQIPLTPYSIIELEQGVITAENLLEAGLDMIENPPPEVTGPESGRMEDTPTGRRYVENAPPEDQPKEDSAPQGPRVDNATQPP